MDVQDDVIKERKIMVHKSVTQTESGETTTYIVRGQSTETFRIVSFKMSDSYAIKNGIARPNRDTEVQVFNSDTLDWKVVVPYGTFTYGEEIEMQDNGKMLDIVKDFLNEYFAMLFAW